MRKNGVKSTRITKGFPSIFHLPVRTLSPSFHAISFHSSKSEASSTKSGLSVVSFQTSGPISM